MTFSPMAMWMVKKKQYSVCISFSQFLCLASQFDIEWGGSENNGSVEIMVETLLIFGSIFIQEFSF
jgi:hypothetical protein